MGNMIATVSHIHLLGRRTGKEVAANARLIAAAPELLEALKASEGCAFPEGGRQRAIRDQAQAAIAKAEGE